MALKLRPLQSWDMVLGRLGPAKVELLTTGAPGEPYLVSFAIHGHQLVVVLDPEAADTLALALATAVEAHHDLLRKSTQN